jgi:hypothetical protein
VPRAKEKRSLLQRSQGERSNAYRGIREYSYLLPGGKIIHHVIIPGQLFWAFTQPTTSAGCPNRNYNTQSSEEKSRFDSP